MGKIVTIDFETYYDKEYSLSKLTTAEYINSPLFEIIGVAASVNGGEPQWHDSIQGNDSIRTFLSNLGIGEKGTLVVAHNAMFDGAILEWTLGLKPWRYFCTMMGARPFITPFTGKMSLASCADYLNLGRKGTEVQQVVGLHRADFNGAAILRYAAYCMQDVDLAWKLFLHLYKQMPNDEKQVLDLTIKKFTRPKLRLDKSVIDDSLNQVKADKVEALEKTGLQTPDELMSNPKFAKLLVSYGVEPPTKTSPTTGRLTYAFAKSDPEFVCLLDHVNPAVRNLINARLKFKSTIEETRLKRFQSVASCTNKSELAAPLLYYGAHSGRFSGLDKLNLQNLGRKSALRRAIIAPPGYKIVAGDLSQIEARITAALAGQENLLDMFRYYDTHNSGARDVYCEFGDKVYARHITKADERERFVAKTGVLSLGFQSGANKFYEAMKSFGIEDFSRSQAQQVVLAYRTTFNKVPLLWEKMETAKRCLASGQGYKIGPVSFLLGQVLLPNGMFLTYPKLTAIHAQNYKYRFGREWRELYGGKLTENIVQALARIVMTTAELRLARAGVTAALSVHDELVYVIKESQVYTFKKALHKALTAPVKWMPELPINCEIGVGDNYGEAK